MNTTSFDVGPLTWVKGEIDLALERAGEALRAAAAGDASALKQASVQLHQAHGALAIVGLDGITQFSDALEKLFAKLESGEVSLSAEVAATADIGLQAISHYLDDLVAGNPDQPLRLYPQYAALLEAAGETTPPASDLFYPDLSLRPPRREEDPQAIAPEQLGPYLKTARMGFQRGLLKWLRGNTDGLAEMRTAIATIEASQDQPARRTLWWAALGLLDALAAGKAAASDAALRKLNARLDTQIRKLIEGSGTIAERLLRDVLYQVAVAPAGGDQVAMVKSAFQLAEQIPSAVVDIDAVAKRPIVAQLRDILGSTKDDWNRFCSGTAAALPRFHQRVEDSVALARSLGHAEFARLIQTIADAAAALRKDPLRQDETFAIEMATALLLAENAISAYPAVGEDFATQVDAMASRLEAIVRGETLSELAVPHLDDISRRAQEKLLMAQVVREITANLATIEQALDAFFRNPAEKEGLAALHTPLQQVGGALAILDQEGAAGLLRECEAQIKTFSSGDPIPQGAFEDVAGKLSALGFFVDQLRHGPASLDAILNPKGHEEAGTDDDAPTIEAGINLNKRLTQTLIGALRDKPEDSELRDELKLQLETLREDAQLIADEGLERRLDTAIAALDENATAPALEEAIAPLVQTPEVITPSEETVRLANASSETLDAELLSIFLEEAHEVLATLGSALPVVANNPHDQETLTTIRRSFHTLKGSGRMVGLVDLGEAAWGVEQVLNGWLQREADANAELQAMLESATELFGRWVVSLNQGDSQPPEDVDALTAACRRLQLFDEEGLPLSSTAAALPEAPAPASAAPVAEAPPAETAATAKVLEFPAPTPIEIGNLSLSPALFDTYLGEARTHIQAMQSEFGAAEAPPSEALIRAAHTLGGISATVGIAPVRSLVQTLESTLVSFASENQVIPSDGRALVARTIGALEGMIGAVAGRRMPQPDLELEAGLAALVPAGGSDMAGLLAAMDAAATLASETAPEPEPELEPEPEPEPQASEVMPSEPLPLAEVVNLPVESEPIVSSEAVPELASETLEIEFNIVDDEIDDQLLPIFLEESADLMPAIGTILRDWQAAPDDDSLADSLQRRLHTLKGGARMAGAMILGELVHAMETLVEEGVHKHGAQRLLDALDTAYDRCASILERLSRGEPSLEPVVREPEGNAASIGSDDAASPASVESVQLVSEADSALDNVLRVRAKLIDDLVNNSGEIAITRSRIEGEVRTLKGSLLELTENVSRLRTQLREIEIQAESQMQSHQSLAQEKNLQFDPLEFDRFTRFQELTRIMAESVNDVATIQHTLLLNLDNTDAALMAQARLNRDLSQSLMSVRMVPFNSVADRLYRVVRQATKDSGKRASLDIRGAQIELDRSVLDAMIAPIEHLLRNAIAHGLESTDVRRAAGKSDVGEITITLAQTGNEICIALADDGAGLDYARIQKKAEQRGLLQAGSKADEATLIDLIFTPGFSTADELTALSGRGIGMDVVKSEVQSLGGRIDVTSQPGKGARFGIYLPLTLAVAQGVLVRSGERTYIIPAGMVAQVRELKPAAIEEVRQAGFAEWQSKQYTYYFLPHLLGHPDALPEPARRHWLMLLQAGAQQIALEVDAMEGNQEVVVKNIGAQLARVTGIAGATVLGDGEISLIINPIALVGHRPRSSWDATATTIQVAEVVEAKIPTIFVVDDSLTVRKITGRLLERSGYHVVTAKDGVDALEQMVEMVPDVMLVDIEMPRMDGFDLTRNVRADARLKEVPIIMITSRTAEKHRNYAAEIGVNHYLGKPYDEDELLRVIGGFLKA